MYLSVLGVKLEFLYRNPSACFLLTPLSEESASFILYGISIFKLMHQSGYSKQLFSFTRDLPDLNVSRFERTKLRCESYLKAGKILIFIGNNYSIFIININKHYGRIFFSVRKLNESLSIPY